MSRATRPSWPNGIGLLVGTSLHIATETDIGVEHVTVRLGADDITFVIHMVELLHVDRLLYVGYYEPEDDGRGNHERCEAYFTHAMPGPQACIRAWDIDDAGPPSLED